jgi:hypothetical protein
VREKQISSSLEKRLSLLNSFQSQSSFYLSSDLEMETQRPDEENSLEKGPPLWVLTGNWSIGAGNAPTEAETLDCMNSHKNIFKSLHLVTS